MPEEKTDVTPDSSSALGEAIASSPEAQEQIRQSQEAQDPTAEEGVTQEQAEPQAEEPRVPYSRLKEVVDEKNWYRQQLEQRLAQSQAQQQPQQPAVDPYAGMTAEEEKFFRLLDARAEKIAEKKLSQIAPVLEAGTAKLAALEVQQFRNAHPDVKPNSPEEIAIAEKISVGYHPNDAYKIVMYEVKVAEAQKQGNAQVKQKIQAKKQANVEQQSIPQGATPPTKEKLTLRQRIEREAQNMQL